MANDSSDYFARVYTDGYSLRGGEEEAKEHEKKNKIEYTHAFSEYRTHKEYD